MIDSLIAFLTPDLMLQKPDEARWLYDQLVPLRPKRILEIGHWMGGTAVLLCALGAEVVSVDPAPQSVRAWELPFTLWWFNRELGRPPEVVTVDANSRSPDVIESLRELGPYDVVFIDGAHEDDYVEADWRNYQDFAPVIGFHDIYGYHDDALIPPNFGPPRLWRRLKAEYRTAEIQSPPACGIGLVYR